MREGVRIVPYDPAWPSAYEDCVGEFDRIASDIKHHVEHIGSTAVPHMEAKPIIDILIGLDSCEGLKEMCQRLVSNGYELKEPAAAEDERRFLVKRDGQGIRKAHVHLAMMGSRQWQDLLTFRDALRANGELAKRYLALKHRLADRFPFDVEAYTSGKGDFVLAELAAES